jgi:hypothetical protein
MNRLRAFDILRAYAIVLRRVPLFTTALPQSLLRHDKDTIKRAIKATASFVEENEYTMSTLEDAYSSLALFIPDDEAAAVGEAQHVRRPEAADHTEAGLTDHVTQTKQRISQDRQALLEEFRRSFETT